MYESIALAAGAGIGVATSGLSARARGWVIVVGGLVVGFAVSSLSGELELSPAFLVFDVGQVIVAAICSAALIAAWGRRRAAS